MNQRTRPLFSVGVTTLIALCLIIPLAIRLLTTTEPFPAMLFPAGGAAVPVVHNQVIFTQVVVVGYKADGETVIISPSDVSRVMPEFTYIFDQIAAAEDFGQSADTRVAITIKGLHHTFMLPRRVPSESERAQARSWLRTRLQRLQLSPSRIAVRNEWLTVAYDTGRVVSMKVASEHVVRLD